jgi:hypothetical protein
MTAAPARRGFFLPSFALPSFAGAVARRYHPQSSIGGHPRVLARFASVAPSRKDFPCFETSSRLCC